MNSTRGNSAYSGKSKCWPLAVFVLSITSLSINIGLIVSSAYDRLWLQVYCKTEKKMPPPSEKQDMDAGLPPNVCSSPGATSGVFLHLNGSRNFQPDKTVSLTFNIHHEALLHDDVDANEEWLTVRRDGCYHIYSSVLFLPYSFQPCSTYTEKIWRQIVKRTNPRSNMTSDLLMAYHTCCDMCLRERVTSYTAGFFHLKDGDLLNVEISGQGLVYFEKSISFFGLMRMNNGICDDNK